MVLPKIETYPLFRCVSGFIMDWIPYMYTVAKIPKTGVVLVMNLFVAVAFLAFGELANLLLRCTFSWSAHLKFVDEIGRAHV